MSYSNFIIIFISFSFIIYGFSGVLSNKMKEEYLRWGFNDYRIIISSIQLLCALFLLFGLFYPFFVIYCVTIFFFMMLGAIVVRVRIRDGFLEILPALMYCVLNAILIYTELCQI